MVCCPIKAFFQFGFSQEPITFIANYFCVSFAFLFTQLNPIFPLFNRGGVINIH